MAQCVESPATIYTDEHRGYLTLESGDYNHESVKHSVSEYVNGMAHTNGIESFWVLLKRGYHGTYHHMSEKHLARYVQEFAGCFNMQELDAHVQMSDVVKGLSGQRLRCKGLLA